MVKIGIKEGANCGVAVKDDLSGNPPHAIRLPNNVYLTSDLTHPSQHMVAQGCSQRGFQVARTPPPPLQKIYKKFYTPSQTHPREEF